MFARIQARAVKNLEWRHSTLVALLAGSTHRFSVAMQKITLFDAQTTD